MNTLSDIHQTEIVDAVPATVSPFTMWLDSLDVSPATLQTYTFAIRDFENWIAENGIADIQEKDILCYKSELAGRINPKTRKKFSASTIQMYVGTVKRFFKWTARQGIYRNVADGIKTPSPSRAHKKDYLTTLQVKEVLSTAKGDSEKDLRDYALLRLLVTTGLRTIEVSRANVEDLRTVGDMTVLYIQGKGEQDKGDYVEIAEDTERAIRQYLKARGSYSENEPLFTGVGKRARTRMRRESISRIVKESMREAGIDDSRHTAHSLRHTAATLNLLNGGTLEETQQLLRHTNINTTMIYSHALDKANNHSASRIDGLLD